MSRNKTTWLSVVILLCASFLMSCASVKYLCFDEKIGAHPKLFELRKAEANYNIFVNCNVRDSFGNNSIDAECANRVRSEELKKHELEERRIRSECANAVDKRECRFEIRREIYTCLNSSYTGWDMEPLILARCDSFYPSPRASCL